MGRIFNKCFFVAMLLCLCVCGSAHAVFNVEKSFTGSYYVFPSVLDRDHVYAGTAPNVGSIGTFEVYKKGPAWQLLNTIEMAGGVLKPLWFTSSISGYFLEEAENGKVNVKKSTDECVSSSTLISLPSVEVSLGEWLSFDRMKFVNANTGFIFSENIYSVYRTTNEGASFSSFAAGNTAMGGITDLDSFDGTTIFAVTKYGFTLKSTDSGATWTTVNDGDSKTTGGACIRAVNSNTVYELTWQSGPPNRTYLSYSTDAGAHWQSVLFNATDNPTIPPIIYSMFFMDANVGWAVGYSPLPVYRQVLYRTLNSGVSWESVLPGSAPYATSPVVILDGIKGTPYVWSGTALTTTLSTTKYIYANMAPSIESISPSSLEKGTKEVITVRGSNFETISAIFGSRSTIESLSSDVQVISQIVNSSAEITAEVRVNTGASLGTKTILLRNPDTFTYEASFLVVAPPVPPTSLEITSVSPNCVYRGGANQFLKVAGIGFDTDATFESSVPGISFSINNIIPTEALLFASAESVIPQTSFLLKIRKAGEVAEKSVAIQDSAKDSSSLIPYYNNADGSSAWNLSKDLPIRFNNIPKEGTGKLIVATPNIGMMNKPIEVDFAQITRAGGTYSLKPQSLAGTANGIYSVMLIGPNGQRLGKVKIVIKN